MSAQLAAALVAGYFLGSIPSGYLLARAAGLGDIREMGSGNIGATNVLRTGHKPLAAITLLCDAAKGAIPVLIASAYSGDAGLVAGAAAVVGHMYPVWLRFRGGKGVATGLGVMVAISLPIGLVGLALWLAVAAATRYSSLAALVSYGLAPFYAWYLTDRRVAALALFIAILVFWRHRANIARLLAGTESKIGTKSGHPQSGPPASSG
ncbi:MAG TPA: glycerol-3-phosphate 1-O-acyltransferase PlsY [Alphaproteobacteria bacterium]|nr:glycerol-3-phosphate 1-O-acyltransferase PlsY [Alphaproteobacteria bacterium]